MKNQQINIRKCEKSDLVQIKYIFKEFVELHSKLDSSFIKIENHEDVFENYVSDNLNVKNSIILVATLKNEIVGYCFGKIEEKPPIYPEPLYGYVDNISVSENFQRNGIGEKLFHELLNWFKSKDIKRIEIFAAIQNDKSMNFWRKMGFCPFMEQMYFNI